MILLTQPVEVLIEEDRRAENIRYCAKIIMSDSRAFGKSKEEALGNLIMQNPTHFLGILVEVKENE